MGNHWHLEREREGRYVSPMVTPNLLGSTSHVPIHEWLLPTRGSVKIENGWVRVSLDPTMRRRADRWESELLARFRELEVTPEQPLNEGRLRKFVERFGLLGAPFPGRSTMSTERVENFTEAAGLAGAILRVATAARSGHDARMQDILSLRTFLGTHYEGVELARAEFRNRLATVDWVPRSDPQWQRWIGIQRVRVAVAVTWWLSDVRTVVTWNAQSSADLRVRWTGGPWGAVGGQLLHAIRREQLIATCDYCGQEFRPLRRPKAGARSTCCKRPDCRRLRGSQAMRSLRARHGAHARVVRSNQQ
jgi:hypothetical protein